MNGEQENYRLGFGAPFLAEITKISDDKSELTAQPYFSVNGVKAPIFVAPILRGGNPRIGVDVGLEIGDEVLLIAVKAFEGDYPTAGLLLPSYVVGIPYSTKNEANIVLDGTNVKLIGVTIETDSDIVLKDGASLIVEGSGDLSVGGTSVRDHTHQMTDGDPAVTPLVTLVLGAPTPLQTATTLTPITNTTTRMK